MSSDHVGWVYRHSSAKGAVFQVHHAIADSVNDMYEHEFWMRMGRLAQKARVHRGTAQDAVAWLVDNEFLELLSEEDRQRSGKPARYRFLFPDVPVVYESRNTPTSRLRREGVAAEARGGSRESREGVAGEPRPYIEPKENPSLEPKVNTLVEVGFFDAFWSAYPRKTAKPDARRAWTKALKRADAHLIIAGAERYAADPNLPEPRYQPHPATWLNGDRWDDDPLPAARFASNGRTNGNGRPVDRQESAVKRQIQLIKGAM